MKISETVIRILSAPELDNLSKNQKEDLLPFLCIELMNLLAYHNVRIDINKETNLLTSDFRELWSDK